MEYLTDAEFEQALQDCNWRDGKAVSDIVSASYTNVKFNEVILEKQIACDGAGRYFTGFFGTRLWEDGQGMDEVREYATPPYIPVSYEYFVEKMKPCKGANRDDCDWDACVVPEGGRGTLPPFQMFEWGIETPRQCIANIRHIRDFRYWAGKVIENRARYDEHLMNLFLTLMAWKTAGHKVVLEYQKALVGGVPEYTPWPSADPRNPFRGFRYNYMEEFFPAVGFPENIGPMSIDALEQLARTWTHNCNDYYVAKGSRGQKIWEFWYVEDWYREEAIQNPDYMEKIKETMPANLFAGYSLEAPREVIGNFAMKQMPWLPRLTESSAGGLIPVDTHVGVPIEHGDEPLLNPAWQEAPFAIALIPSPQQGSIITRPDLNTSPEGFSIMPITGSGNWRIRNDYDKECNKHLNKPYSEKHYEMGMQMDDPDAAIAIIHRLRKFRTNPENFCNLLPVTPIAPNAVCNDFLSIGCHQSGRKPHQASVTEMDFSQAVSCTQASCGNPTTGGDYLFEVTIDRVANQEDFNSLRCDCGSTVQVLIGAEGAGGGDPHVEVSSVATGIVRDLSFVFPYGKVWIELQADLNPGECITGIICEDDSPTEGAVVNCQNTADPATTGVWFTLDSILVEPGGDASGVADTVNIEYFDADGASLGAAFVGTIAEVDYAGYRYRVTSAEPGFQCSGTTAIPAHTTATLTAT